jgi:transposase
MSNKPIRMSKVKQVLQWHSEGVSKKRIGLRAGVNRNTVKSYIRQFMAMNRPVEELLALSDKELEEQFAAKPPYEPDERLSTLTDLFPDMEKKIKKGYTRRRLWEEYKLQHPDGYGLSQFKVIYRIWAQRVNATMHIEHKAGDKMYVDFAGDRLSLTDPNTGEIVKVEVFVAILGSSQLTYVEATMNQQKENFIRACENALYYFGGVPLAIVPDNLKAAVVKSDRYEPTLNETFRDFVEHYGMAALPAGPYKPRHKALVEGAVKISYTTIYPVIRQKTYTSLDELNRDILIALEAHNNRYFQGRNYSRRQLFEEIERPALQPLPLFRYGIKSKRVATVMKNNHICLGEDKHYYSVPYHYIGKRVNVLYNVGSVDIYYRNERIASHKRDPRPFLYTTDPNHLASKHNFMTDWTPEKFIERATAIGDDTRIYIIEVLGKRQHPEQAYRTCQGILGLSGRAGKDRLNAACRRAHYFGDYSYKTIVAILHKRLESEPLDLEQQKPVMPIHMNIRGGTYYA